MLAVCWSVPDVAVIVTVEVTGVDPPPPPPPLPLSPPPPHPETSPIPKTASTNGTSNPRRRRNPNQPNDSAATVKGSPSFMLDRTAADCAGAVIVSVVVAAPPDGVTVVGLNAQVAPAGSPEHAKLTTALNPFCGVTTNGNDPVAPGFKLSPFAVGAESVNEGGDAVTFSEITVEAVMSPLAPVIVIV